MKSLFYIFFLVHLSLISFSQINPDSTYIDLGPDMNFCTGYIHILDAGPGFDTYLWQDGSADQTFLVSEAGTYWVHAYMDADMYADTVMLGYWPYPDPNLGNDTMLCAESSLLLEATPGFAYYFWMDGSTLPYFQVIDDGMYVVTVYDIHGCQGTDTIIVEFTNTNIDLGADTIICENGSSLLLDAGEGFTSYLWQDGSTSQFFLVDVEIFEIGSHNFSVSAIDTLNCEYADSILVVICEHTDVTQTIYENLKIYPNPTNDKITIEMQSISDDVLMIEILDPYGKVVFRDENIVIESHNIINIDVSSFSPGIYYLRLSNQESYSWRKLIIQN